MIQPANPGAGSAEPVGAGERIVKQGETVMSIADETGHFWQKLWDHPDNADLKTRRGSPHVLLPGDALQVPPLERKEEPGTTEQRHRFRLLGSPMSLEIEVCQDGEPRAQEPFTLVIEGRIQSGTVPANGVLVAEVYPSDRKGELTVGEGKKQTKHKLQFGHLDPGHSRSGAVGRLRNLGYLGQDESDEAVSAAMKRFQTKKKLPVTGALDDATARKLVQDHGS